MDRKTTRDRQDNQTGENRSSHPVHGTMTTNHECVEITSSQTQNVLQFLQQLRVSYPVSLRDTSMAKIYVLQHHPVENLGTIADALEGSALAWQYVRVGDGQAVPANMKGAGGLIVMGGPMGVYQTDRYPWLRDEMRLINDAMKSNLPVLGVCLGAQILAAALGREGRSESQRQGNRMASDPLERFGQGRSSDAWIADDDDAVPLAWRHLRSAGGRGLAGVIRKNAVPGVPPRRQDLRLPVSFRGDARRRRRDGGRVRKRIGSRKYSGRSNDRASGRVPSAARNNLEQGILPLGVPNSGYVLTQVQRRTAAFHFQQLALALQSPSIAAEMSRRANCAMTWDDNRHWIRAVGGADGADCARPSDALRDFGVGARLARGNRAELVPYRELKRSTADIHRRRRHLRAAGDVIGERVGPLADARVIASDSGRRPESSRADSRRAARRPASDLLRPSRRSRSRAACRPQSDGRAPNRQSSKRFPRRHHRPVRRVIHTVTFARIMHLKWVRRFAPLETYNPANRLL